MMNALARAAIVATILAGSALPAFADTRVIHTPRGTIIVYDDRFEDRNVGRLSDLPARQFFERLQDNN